MPSQVCKCLWCSALEKHGGKESLQRDNWAPDSVTQGGQQVLRERTGPESGGLRDSYPSALHRMFHSLGQIPTCCGGGVHCSSHPWRKYALKPSQKIQGLREDLISFTRKSRETGLWWCLIRSSMRARYKALESHFYFSMSMKKHQGVNFTPPVISTGVASGLEVERYLFTMRSRKS